MSQLQLSSCPEMLSCLSVQRHRKTTGEAGYATTEGDPAGGPLRTVFYLWDPPNTPGHVGTSNTAAVVAIQGSGHGLSYLISVQCSQSVLRVDYKALFPNLSL